MKRIRRTVNDLESLCGRRTAPRIAVAVAYLRCTAEWPPHAAGRDGRNLPGIMQGSGWAGLVRQAAEGRDVGPELSRAWHARMPYDPGADGKVRDPFMPDIPRSAEPFLAQLVRESDVYPRPLDLFNWSLRHLSARQAEGGQYFTLAELTRLMVGVVDPRDGHRVLDPACGSAGLLVAASRHVKERLGSQASLRATGRDYLAEVLAVARMNLAVHHLEGDLVRGDSLQQPEKSSYDIVLANPPFNTPAWTEETRHDDPRWRDTPPPRSRADFAWLLHCAHALAPQGRAALLMPNTAASRQVAHIEQAIRKRMVDDDLIEAVIALPPRLLRHVQNACSLWLLNRDKSKQTDQADRRGRVLFIDATRQYKAIPGSRERRLPEEAVELILATVAEWRTGESAGRIGAVGWSAVASAEEIAGKDFDLLPTRYVDLEQADETVVRIADLTAELQGCFQESRRLDQRLLDMLGSW